MRIEEWPAPTMADWLARARMQQVLWYGGDPADLPAEERAQWTKNMVLAMIVEATEVLDEVKGWKHWQADARPFDRDAYITELVDVVKFAGALAVAVGCTDAEWNAAWLAKDAVLARRAVDRGEVG